jgi:hypothetical protein
LDNPTSYESSVISQLWWYDYGFGGGFAQVGGGVGTGGANQRSGYYIAPAFDILLTAADMNLKNRIVRSELVYKITAGANGTKLLHLYPRLVLRFHLVKVLAVFQAL